VSELCVGRRELNGRLTSAQTAMMLQEETIKRADRDRSQLVERIGDMERSLAAADNEKRLLQVYRLTGVVLSLRQGRNHDFISGWSQRSGI